VLVSFMSEHGRFLARVQGPVSGNVLLRRTQYRWADDASQRLELAQAFVIGKALNTRHVLLRAQRDHGEKPGLDQTAAAAEHIAALMPHIEAATDLDALRGIEGDIGRHYFGAFDALITAQREFFQFTGRNRRPPLDPVNALLSFVYTLLAHDCVAALEGVGLDPQVGFLHTDRPGRPSLALDLMEEFRPCFADRLVLSLINLRQVSPRDFIHTESGAVQMSDDARKALLVAYQKRKQEELLHPFLEESAPLGLFFHFQALLLARHLRGDLDGYPPALWK